jgi:hypothetical protein
MVKCKYVVDGREYVNYMDAGDAKSTKKEALQILFEDFFPGKKIAINYDPENPYISNITPPSTFQRRLPLIVGLILTLGGTIAAWIISVSLYLGSPLELDKVFKIPEQLEYKVSRIIIKTFRIHESEEHRLASYLDYVESIYRYIDHNNNPYNKYFTRERAFAEKKRTLEQLVFITKDNSDMMFRYGGMLYDFLHYSDHQSEARAVLVRLREKYPVEFESSYLANDLKPVNEANK